MSPSKKFVAAVLACAFGLSYAQESRKNSKDVLFIHMGASDCPPCVAWRNFDLPQLQKTDVWTSIRFHHVTKTIGSPVPSSFFLPDDVKPYKSLLDAAGDGIGASPQQVILVDGRVYDYHVGAREAKELALVLAAARDGGKAPVSRCLRRKRGQGCVETVND